MMETGDRIRGAEPRPIRVLWIHGIAQSESLVVRPRSVCTRLQGMEPALDRSNDVGMTRDPAAEFVGQSSRKVLASSRAKRFAGAEPPCALLEWEHAASNAAEPGMERGASAQCGASEHLVAGSCLAPFAVAPVLDFGNRAIGCKRCETFEAFLPAGNAKPAVEST